MTASIQQEAREPYKELNEISEGYLMPITRYPDIPLYPEKKFVCNGKHQYRKVGSEWICQCGRNIKD